MKRLLYADLIAWKNSQNRKPLMLHGARQVGKTWLLKRFGKNEFSRVHHIDFDKDRAKLAPLFDDTIAPRQIVDNLSLLFEKPIDLNEDLLIFDEIQQVPRALTSLKYFCEELPNTPVCAAGSLLGVALSDESYPVGKVQNLDLFPLSYEEFLLNYSEELLYPAYLKGIEERRVSKVLHDKLLGLLKIFYVTGGMPEALETYLKNKNLELSPTMKEVRAVQQDLIRTYLADFAKHAGKNNSVHISTVFENVPMQLASYFEGTVRRYRFKDVISGKKGYAELRGPIDWLVKSGLVSRVSICNRAGIPLLSFCKDNTFKLYLFDVGLLGAMLDISPFSLLQDDYGLTRGFYVENFVAAEFRSAGIPLFAWRERNSEIEFLVDHDGKILPIEVKSGRRTKAKSLAQFIVKYSPGAAYTLSGKNMSTGGGVRQNIPLYYAGKFSRFLPQT